MMVRYGSLILFRSGDSGLGPVSGPRSRLSCCIAGLFSLLASIAVASDPTSTIRDPLFGLSLNPDVALLERTDPRLISRCDIGGAGSEQQSWVFAATSASDGEYLILGGLAR